MGTSKDVDVRPTVISLHGIRTRGAWQKSLTHILNKAGFDHRPLEFGFFRAISLINPWARKKKVDWFLGEYTRIRETTAGPIFVIAHSFGSYLVAVAMERYSDIKFERIIFCGSIVEDTYDWDTIVSGRGQVKGVLNQYGTQDIWVRLAEWGLSDAGSSGFSGFQKTAGGAVSQQSFQDFTHSQYFFELNFRENWIPFLKGEQARTIPKLNKGGPNWKFRLLLAILCATVLAVISVLVWPFLGAALSAGVTDSATEPVGKLENSSQSSVSRSEGLTPMERSPESEHRDELKSRLSGTWIAKKLFNEHTKDGCPVVQDWKYELRVGVVVGNTGIQGSYALTKTTRIGKDQLDLAHFVRCTEQVYQTSMATEYVERESGVIDFEARKNSLMVLIHRVPQFWTCGRNECNKDKIGKPVEIFLKNLESNSLVLDDVEYRRRVPGTSADGN